MVRLRALAEHRLLGFDEIADLRLFAEYRPGAQPREGADLAAPADRRSFDMAVGANLHAVRDGHPGTEKDIGLDRHVAAELRVPGEPDGIGRDQARAVEIGGASCRERVCRYV